MARQANSVRQSLNRLAASGQPAGRVGGEMFAHLNYVRFELCEVARGMFLFAGGFLLDQRHGVGQRRPEAFGVTNLRCALEGFLNIVQPRYRSLAASCKHHQRIIEDSDDVLRFGGDSLSAFSLPRRLARERGTGVLDTRDASSAFDDFTAECAKASQLNPQRYGSEPVRLSERRL